MLSKNHVSKAKICSFPNCERCDKYKEFDGNNYCTVQQVITKQEYLILKDRIRKLEDSIL